LVQWLLLGVLGIIWTAFLMPIGRKRSDARSVEDFERRMELLAQAEVHGTSGRWIVTPRKGVRFLGPRERQQARVRARRRRVFVFLLEAIGLALLIGVVPPLRASWVVAGVLGGLLIIYTWALLVIKARAGAEPERPVEAPAPRIRLPEPTTVIENDQHVTVLNEAFAAV
jgi:Flp pilus assembly protein TadB